MADQFLGEIRIFPCNATPQGWMSCDGQLLNISSQYKDLFSLLGTRFGGNGKTTFGLPNLNGHAPLGAGAGPELTERELGNSVGKETLDPMYLSIPLHNHTLFGYKFTANMTSGNKTLFAQGSVGSGSKPQVCDAYATETEHLVKMGDHSLSPFGSTTKRHSNMQPYLALRFCIAINGTYPPRARD